MQKQEMQKQQIQDAYADRQRVDHLMDELAKTRGDLRTLQSIAWQMFPALLRPTYVIYQSDDNDGKKKKKKSSTGMGLPMQPMGMGLPMPMAMPPPMQPMGMGLPTHTSADAHANAHTNAYT